MTVGTRPSQRQNLIVGALPVGLERVGKPILLEERSYNTFSAKFTHVLLQQEHEQLTARKTPTMNCTRQVQV